ncbi:MAG: DUF1846 domain-containing protein [Nanoarchaeota archaeon]|nr:DUF1846 domain-containing protein [Nanoarchaeota archaeon]MBU1622793.1 DUF1846 domain-containing protein [Nanoarchaeota archaeon]
MVFKVGFDTEKYVEEQTKYILERAAKFGNKLYLEFGGKLILDYHAARVLPGYDPNAKIRILQALGENLEIIICVSAEDLQKGRIVGSLGINYGDFALKMIDDLRGYGLHVSTVVINMFSGETAALQLKDFLVGKGVKVYTTGMIAGYPLNIEKIASASGYGEEPFIETTKPIVVVTASGPGSGKMSTCLRMVYQDKQKGIETGYAKFETFPIWNLPLDHPINTAYEAATADIKDFNLIDPHHLKAYEKVAVNYNRDVENFVIIQKMIKAIISNDNFMLNYHSPTDMGVNMAKVGIIDDAICQEAAKEEVIRRYFRYSYEYILGLEKKDTVEAAEMLLEKLDLKVTDRSVVLPARKAAEEAQENGKGHKEVYCGAAIELGSGEIITGKNSPLLHAESSVILNSIKVLAGIPDAIYLLSEEIIKQIKDFKSNAYGENTGSLDVEETLIALAISAATNPTAKLALDHLSTLKNVEMHTTHVLKKGDESPIRKLGINLTTDGKISGKKLYLS